MMKGFKKVDVSTMIANVDNPIWFENFKLFYYADSEISEDAHWKVQVEWMNEKSCVLATFAPLVSRWLDKNMINGNVKNEEIVFETFNIYQEFHDWTFWPRNVAEGSDSFKEVIKVVHRMNGFLAHREDRKIWKRYPCSPSS